MKIICFGDSNTWGYDPRGYFGSRYDNPWPALLAEKLQCDIANHGENGREIPIKNVVFPADMDYLIIMLGTNDLLQGATAEATCSKMAEFLEELAVERRKIILIAPPPMNVGEWVIHKRQIEDSRMLAEYYQRLAKRVGIHYSDAGQWNITMAFDGVHFTEAGHRAFAEGVYKELIGW